MWRGDDYSSQVAGRYVPQPYAADDTGGIPVVGAGPRVWGPGCPAGGAVHPRNRNATYYDRLVPGAGPAPDPTLMGAWHPQIGGDGRPVTHWPAAPYLGQPAKRWHGAEPPAGLEYPRERLAPGPCPTCTANGKTAGGAAEQGACSPCGISRWARGPGFTLLLLVVLLFLVAQLFRPAPTPIFFVSAAAPAGAPVPPGPPKNDP